MNPPRHAFRIIASLALLFLVMFGSPALGVPGTSLPLFSGNAVPGESVTDSSHQTTESTQPTPSDVTTATGQAPPTTMKPLPPPKTEEEALAQEIVQTPSIALNTQHPSGIQDSADANTNVNDSAVGTRPLRSEYECAEGRAPGGRTNINPRTLAAMLEIGKKYKLTVSAVTGACHSHASLHYDGKAFDVAAVNDVPIGSDSSPEASAIYADILNTCKALGAVQAFGPGDRAHDTHIHCGFP